MEISSKHNGMRVFSVVTNLGCGEIKFFHLNGLIKMLTEFRCVEPIPLLFWY